MTALISSELLKIRTTRGWYAYLTVLLLLSGLAVAGDIGSTEDVRRGTLDFQLGLVDGAGIAALLSIILGITLVTTEFRHGTITPTLLVAPVRERVLASKGIATAGVSLLFGLVSLAVIGAVAVSWLSIIGADLHLAERDVGVRAGQVLLLAVLFGLLGAAIGTLVQSQVAALVGTLVWIFLAETLLIGVLGLLDLDGVAPYLPFQALDAADGTGGGDLLSYWPGVGVSLAWVAVIGAAGAVRLRGRDIT